MDFETSNLLTELPYLNYLLFQPKNLKIEPREIKKLRRRDEIQYHDTGVCSFVL